MTNPAADNVIDSGRFAWRGVTMLAGSTDTVVASAEALADQVGALLAAVSTSQAAATHAAARSQASCELAAASARLRQAATRLEVAAAHLVDREQANLVDAERTSRTWLARHSGVSHRDASTLVRAASTCDQFRTVGAAFYAGELTLGHVDAVSTIIPSRLKGAAREAAVRKILDVQGVLVETATRSSIREFSEFCGRVRDRLDQDGPGDSAAEPSRIWLHRLFNGRWALSGDLTADDGAILATILADLRARRARARRNADEPTQSAATNTETEPETEGGERPTYSEHTAQDLLDLVRSGAGSDRPGRVGVYLHIDLDDLNAPVQEPDEYAGLVDVLEGRRTAHTEADLDISDETLWGLMAGADVTPIFNRGGRTVSFGRTRRFAPPILRRVIAHRDRRCRVPGCDRPALGCDAHHVHHFEDGGTTDAGNCAAACGFHHHQHHDAGLGIAGDADGVLVFTRPDGTPLDAEPLYRRRRTA